jgi:DNA polymerase-3 subunit gamma/tau
MQDLLEITHFLTRVKVAPNAEGFFDGASSEGRRAAEMAAKLSMPSLTRAWQMLLKGLIEVRDATRPISACEMALIRLAYAADLPPTDRLVRDLLDGDAAPRGTSAPARSAQPSGAPRAGLRSEPMAQAAPAMAAANAPMLRTVEDIVALADPRSVLKVQIESYVRPIRLEPGVLVFSPAPGAPSTLAADLTQKLKDWTGQRWVVTLAREGGEPSIAERRKQAKAARMESVMQEPLVRAVLDRFPGAEITAVRDAVVEEAPVAPMRDD